MEQNSETKQESKWHKVDDETSARNTATGVLVERNIDCAGRVGEYNYRITTTHIPGEHWDAEAGEFVAIVSEVDDEAMDDAQIKLHAAIQKAMDAARKAGDKDTEDAYEACKELHGLVNSARITGWD